MFCSVQPWFFHRFFIAALFHSPRLVGLDVGWHHRNQSRQSRQSRLLGGPEVLLAGLSLLINIKKYEVYDLLLSSIIIYYHLLSLLYIVMYMYDASGILFVAIAVELY